jgi:phenylacetic acid degradation operon negative regulatory protein
MPRPQALMFTLLGRHVLHLDKAVASGTFIAVLARLGVSEEAARSTLNRMVRRGHLRRQPVSRRTYLSLTPRTHALLSDGETRIFGQDPQPRRGNDTWTLLSFSIPEARRNDRHSLRVRLAWEGFGLLRDGLWLAPGRVDVVELIDDLELRGHVEVFLAHAVEPTDVAQIVQQAWDLDELRARYDAFLERWDVDRPALELPDALARQIMLITEWRQLLREDPHLPGQYLPGNWPAVRASKTFTQLHDAWSEEAGRIFAELVHSVPISGDATGGAARSQATPSRRSRRP